MNKITINEVEFNKKVEIESAHLMYMGRLPKEVADRKAKEFMNKKFEVQ